MISVLKSTVVCVCVCVCVQVCVFGFCEKGLEICVIYLLCLFKSYD